MRKTSVRKPLNGEVARILAATLLELTFLDKSCQKWYRSSLCARHHYSGPVGLRDDGLKSYKNSFNLFRGSAINILGKPQFWNQVQCCSHTEISNKDIQPHRMLCSSCFTLVDEVGLISLISESVELPLYYTLRNERSLWRLSVTKLEQCDCMYYQMLCWSTVQFTRILNGQILYDYSITGMYHDLGYLPGPMLLDQQNT